MTARVPADAADECTRMDLNMWEMYREMTRTTRGGELLETEAVTLVSSPHAAAFNNLALIRGPIVAETFLASTAAFYGRRKRPFAVFLRAHADGTLETALVARGFRVLVEEPGMTLAVDPGTRCEPPGLVIRPVVDDAGRRAFLAVSIAAWAVYEQPAAFAEDAFATLASVTGPQVQAFVGTLDGVPVAAATLYQSYGVAGIGWVGAVPEHRGRRFAEALTWAVVREGFRRGADFVNLQASPMGHAVYARMGFATPTTYRLLLPPG